MISKSLIIATACFVLYSCSSEVSKTPDKKQEINKSSLFSIEFKKINKLPIIFNTDTLLKFGSIGDEPNSIADTTVKLLPLNDIERLISKADKDECVLKNKEFGYKKQGQFPPLLAYYSGYELPNLREGVLSYIVFKAEVDVGLYFILCNYSPDGKLLDKKEVVISYENLKDTKTGTIEQGCVFETDGTFRITRFRINGTPTESFTWITKEKYEIESTGKFKLLDKKENKKKWDENDILTNATIEEW